MTKDQALQFVASTLARDIARHRRSAIENKNLKQNSQEAVDKIMQVAQALEIESAVRAKVTLFA